MIAAQFIPTPSREVNEFRNARLEAPQAGVQELWIKEWFPENGAFAFNLH
jgi:hypothetical protein